MKTGFMKRLLCFLLVLLSVCFAIVGCQEEDNNNDVNNNDINNNAINKEVGDQRAAEKALGVPAFTNSPYFALNNNIPTFTDEEKAKKVSYEFYSELDSLGRCGYGEACVGKDIMPTEEREDIGSVKPSGWINKKYDTELVDGGYIYNRCHVIGFQLTGENANKQNLITGTRYMNVSGMLPFENMVADYVKETGNHVMYRVTPVYDGNDLVACGVKLEGYSVEDNGDGVCFNVYVYNVQPGIIIDYATGESWLAGSGEIPKPTETSKPTESAKQTESEPLGEEEPKYILNTSTRKIHLTTCSGIKSIKDGNKQEYNGSYQSLIEEGYTACGTCKPAA